MKFINKLKTIWKLNHTGLYVSAIIIFLGAIMINVIQHNTPFVNLNFLFGEGVLLMMMFGIGLLTWSDE